jgi:acyl-CoA hydrolase
MKRRTGMNSSKNNILQGKSPDQSLTTLSSIMLPSHANPSGIFVHGGEIMKLMDNAAGVAAVRHARSPVVTLRAEGINFHHPIRVGNYVSVTARLTYTGTSSMEVQVKVDAEDLLTSKRWEALTAYFVFVALDKNQKPIAVPPLIVSTEEERRLYSAGEERYTTCRIDEQAKILCAME